MTLRNWSYHDEACVSQATHVVCDDWSIENFEKQDINRVQNLSYDNKDNNFQ